MLLELGLGRGVKEVDGESLRMLVDALRGWIGYGMIGSVGEESRS